ncbi:MAG TPA: hypothetical protein VIC06_03080 [Solirubrobacteraceae bacterium]|jgi:hypothetical protein
MSDKEQVQATGEDEEVRKLDLDESQRMIALGFDPVAPVYVSNREYSSEAILKALTCTERGKPHTVGFGIEVRDAEDCILPMEIELLQVVFPTNLDRETGQPDTWDDPAWYLRGYLGRCPVNPNGEVVRMHVYTHELHEHERWAEIQIVRELPIRYPAISLDGQLIYGRGRPCIADRVSR